MDVRWSALTRLTVALRQCVLAVKSRNEDGDVCYIYLKCTEDEATLRFGTKSNQNVTRGTPHKYLTTCQQMFAIHVLLESRQLLETSNRQLQEFSIGNLSKSWTVNPN